MRAIALVGIDAVGGGVLLPGPNGAVSINGVPIAVVGTPATSHGSGPHAAATTASAGTQITIGGLPISAAGDPATCGDPVTGSSGVTVAP